ncbi:MAG: DNA-binding response regulator [Mongoliibacter sp.]|uniref:response regulator transcription factor n=1 Tax=Mongoliibacter sp. TaxID=2022438 RepID=UPI0012EFE92F|nr:response regulator transcription factor [Mongoliibacter sp.]TVP50207.1 MAG: DNA-binding response regulator [Mongoliibacter sp.]
MCIKVAIVDDHELFLLGIGYLIEKSLGIQVSKRFYDGQEVLDYLKLGNTIDLLISDLDMPEIDGFKLLSHLKRDYPNTKVMIMSAINDKETIALCKNLGANGFIRKDSFKKELIVAIDRIMLGLEYFSKGAESSMLFTHSSVYGILSEKYNLTKREIEILQLILNEFMSSEIADKLHCSIFTIKTHRRNLFKKLGIRNLAGLINLINELQARYIEK